MHAPLTIFTKWLLLCSFLFIAACQPHGPAPLTDQAKVTAISSFNQQLKTITSLGNDSLIGPQVRALYASSRPDIHDSVCKAVLKALGSMLLFNTGADPGILPFYYGLGTDSTLSVQSKAAVSIKLANYYAHIVRNADSTDYYLQRANAQPEVLDDTLRAKWYSIQAQLFQLRGKLKEAANSLYKTIAFNEQINDSANNAGGYVNLANVYRGMSDYQKSIELRKKALAYFAGRHDEVSSVTAIGGLAADFIDAKQFDSGRKYFLEAEALFKKGIRSPVAEYYLYLSKGGMYITLQVYDSSRLYFDKAKAILPLFNDAAQEMLFTIASSVAYSRVRNVRAEAKLIEKYIPELLAADDLQSARDAYYCLYNISLRQDIGRSTIDYYLSYDSLKTVLSDKQNRNFVVEMESKYESQKKNLKIQVQQREIKQKNALNWVLILSVIALVLATGIFLIRLQLSRSRQEAKMQQQFTKELLKNTEEERGRIAGELHDGISHELLTLKNNLQHGQSTTEARIDTIINDIRMISRNLHPVMLDKIGLTYSIQHLCEQLMASGQLFVSAEIDYQKQLTPDCELQLYRIIQESLTNVVKYAGALAAKITILSKNDKLLVTIMDNGKGFDVMEKLNAKSAFGLHSLIERGKALGGKTTIASSPQGTIINLEIPVNNGHHNHS